MIIIPIMAPIVLKNKEEIESQPAPHKVGIYPPMTEPRNTAI